MSDYELYGDYTDHDGREEAGPPKKRGWVIFVRLLQIFAACVLIGACLVLAFRMIFSSYYPDAIKQLYYTDSLRAYVTENGIPEALTQDIRVPFESEILTVGEDGSVSSSTSQNGYYYADNLILMRNAGVLQCSVRLNKQAIEDIAEKYGLSDFRMSTSAFRFVLTDDLGRSYEATVPFSDAKLFYLYLKVCFDGVAFDGVSWMRLEITPVGADTDAEGYLQSAICIYENTETYHAFEEYRLKKTEKVGV